MNEAVVEPVPKGWDVSIFADEISPDLDVQLAEVRRAGLKYFDLRSAFGKNVLDLSDGETRDIQNKAEAAGLKVLCIGSPINKHPFNPEERDRELERLKRIGEIAHMLGTRFIRIFTPLTEKAVRQPEYEEIRNWMIGQREYATKTDLVLLVENDADAYAAFPENAQRLFADLCDEHFKAVYDFSNSVLIGYTAIPHWFPWIKPYLGGLHIKDSLQARDEDGEFQITPAGEGEGCIREVLKDLIEDGWAGPVSLEPHLWKYAQTSGLDGVGQFRLSLQGLNKVLEGLV